jgi:hypothetical protein
MPEQKRPIYADVRDAVALAIEKQHAFNIAQYEAERRADSILRAIEAAGVTLVTGSGYSSWQLLVRG